MYVYDMDIANDLLDVLADHTSGLHHYIPIRDRLRRQYGAAPTSPLHALGDAIEEHLGAEENKIGTACGIVDMWLDTIANDEMVIFTIQQSVLDRLDDLSIRCLAHAMFLKRYASGDTAWARCRELVEDYAARM